MMPRKKKNNAKTVETLTHDEASRKNIPTAEYQSVMRKDEQSPIRVAYERRNRDPQPVCAARFSASISIRHMGLSLTRIFNGRRRAGM